MKISVFTLSIFLCSSFYTLNAQSITNVIAKQDGNNAVITYDLLCDGSAYIELFYSEDAGVTYKGPLKSVTGDIGDNILTGKRQVEWNVLLDQDTLLGNNIIFRVTDSKYGKFTDLRDGKIYNTVRIGNQIWMAENLNFKTESDSWCFEQISSNCEKYGRLYKWNNTIDVSPKGWHLPSKNEFITLWQNAGSSEENVFKSLIHGGNSGFSALFGGCHSYIGEFIDVTDETMFWSSTKYLGNNSWFLNIDNKNESSFMATGYIECGFSVRCIKDTNDGIKEHEIYSDACQTIFSIVKNLDKMPPSFFIKHYVEKGISNWQVKGEFERLSDYQKRVTEQARNAKIRELTNDALVLYIKGYSQNINWGELLISQYDADNETYLIQSVALGNFAIPVPATDAPSFKQSWSKMRFQNADYYINNDKLLLAKVEIISPDEKKYIYDSKLSTTYAANNITYNFQPIEVDVNQDNEVKSGTKIENKTTIVGKTDVDLNIPVNQTINDKTFAVIIANENYTQEVKVEFATNDGKVFKDYCEKTLGIPSQNIHFSKDATFGVMKSEIKWISDVIAAYNGQAKVIFYYAGHGMPNEQDKSAFLLPTDGFSSDFETAIKLDDLYNRLTANPSQSITVFLDACFSGSVRDNGMLANARGIKIKPKEGILKGNLIVFSAASGDETAYPYTDKQHGLFTYFILKGLQESKGEITYQNLMDYVIEKVKQQSIVVNQKSQIPTINVSVDLQNTWQIMTFK